MSSSSPFQIAIDGPVAAGKSSASRQLAAELGVLYIDTGAMYRALALAAEQAGKDWTDQQSMEEFVQTVKLNFDPQTGSVTVDGQDVSSHIRTLHIAQGASVVSQFPGVRKVLVARQQEIANSHQVVMEGRDIGIRVLPNAQLKIYLTAALESRVERKLHKLQAEGQNVTAEEIKHNIESRDHREMTRQTDPLRPAEDAWQFDTTDLTLEEVVAAIVDRAQQLGFRQL